jgi:hypothetical protein
MDIITIEMEIKSVWIKLFNENCQTIHYFVIFI